MKYPLSHPQAPELSFKHHIAAPISEVPYPGLIIIHEIWGLNDHTKDVANRYAQQGYTVIAPDLLEGTGILEQMSPDLFKDMQNPEKRHAAQAKMREIIQPMSTKEFSDNALAKIQACFDYLSTNQQCNGNVAIMGFCFGGTYSFFFATKEKRLKACVSFYGQPPSLIENVQNINCPVLGFYGEKDEHLMQSLPTLGEAMKKYGKNFTSKVYKNTGHAFFNDTNSQAYNKEAAEDAWTLSLDFLKKNTS